MTDYLSDELETTGWSGSAKTAVVSLFLYGRLPSLPVAEGPSETQNTASKQEFSGTGSSIGAPLDSIEAALASFIGSVVAVERLSLSQQADRRTRSRFLAGFASSGLPPAAGQLLSALQRLNVVFEALLNDPAALPSIQPQRSNRLTCQQYVTSCRGDLKAAKQLLEDALNDMNDSETDAESGEDEPLSAVKQSLYDECEELYSGLVEPRVALCELVLACRVALTLRTAEVTDFASRKVTETLSDDNLRGKLDSELCGDTLALVKSIPVLQHVFEVAMSTSGLASTRRAEVEAFADDLVTCGLEDADTWIQTYIVPRFFASTQPRTPGDVLNETSGTQNHRSGATLSRTNSVSRFGLSVSRSARAGPEDGDDVIGWLESAERPDASADVLYDALGHVNMWLRRAGLAHEVSVDARGKALPTFTDSANVFLPHSTMETGVWDRTASERYEHACLRHRQLVESREVDAEFAELLTLPDEQFVRACHDDLLVALFDKADEACFTGESRRRVQRRLHDTLRMRVKVFHHNGEIRAVTKPQTATLDDIRNALLEWMPDLPSCRLSYLDEGDKVSVATNAEFADVVRQARVGASSSAGFGSLSHSALGRSATALSCGDVRIELYVDPPPPPPAARSLPTTRRDGAAKRPSPAAAPSNSILAPARTDLDTDLRAMHANMRMIERRAMAFDIAEGDPVAGTTPPFETASTTAFVPSAPPLAIASTAQRTGPSEVYRLQRPAASARQWDLPGGLNSFSLAQHTIVGDDKDEERADRRVDGSLRQSRGSAAPSAPQNLSRAAALRLNRGGRR